MPNYWLCMSNEFQPLSPRKSSSISEMKLLSKVFSQNIVKSSIKKAVENNIEFLDCVPIKQTLIEHVLN